MDTLWFKMSPQEEIIGVQIRGSWWPFFLIDELFPNLRPFSHDQPVKVDYIHALCMLLNVSLLTQPKLSLTALVVFQIDNLGNPESG